MEFHERIVKVGHFFTNFLIAFSYAVKRNLHQTEFEQLHPAYRMNTEFLVDQIFLNAVSISMPETNSSLKISIPFLLLHVELDLRTLK
ncbi:MAG: hypothetical protein CM15mP12_5570 [Gammaproteobacteria bacterium]|nr:MAG: hypothetical protein CM15mP12_5570 [Gammaproteobacteria bacterium]